MAVVFISPKKRQKTFLLGIAICLVLFLITISLWVFLASPTPPPASIVFNEPKIDLNLSILNSAQFQNLQHFTLIPLQFSYTAETANGKTVSGLISADSMQDAAAALTAAGLVTPTLQEVGLGRDNPFVAYPLNGITAPVVAGTTQTTK